MFGDWYFTPLIPVGTLRAMAEQAPAEQVCQAATEQQTCSVAAARTALVGISGVRIYVGQLPYVHRNLHFHTTIDAE